MTKQEYIEISVELKHSEIPVPHQKKLQQLLDKEMHTDKEIDTIRKDKIQEVTTINAKTK